tara:strand:- start:690 stop:923 length:234 start_codon:yes stop_codon:yes gene_type:complete
MKKITSSVKAITIKNRVKELENRLNNLKILVDNLAFNQEQIVKAFGVDAEATEPVKESNQLRIDDEAERLSDSPKKA